VVNWTDYSPLSVGLLNLASYLAGFLVYFESELLKRAQKNFDFRNGRYGTRTSKQGNEG
jgi:hypothetical protein